MEKQLKLEPLHFVVDPLGVRKNMKTSMILRAMYSTCSSNFRKKRQAPVETATLWAGVLLFPLHMAEDTSREVLKRTFEQKSF